MPDLPDTIWPRRALTHGIRQGTRAHSWHLLLIGILIGLLWAGIGFNLWHEYRAAEMQAAKDSANLARAFDENITRTVEAIDQKLLFLRDAYRIDPVGFARGSWASEHGFLDELHVQVSVAGADGTVLWSNLGPFAPDLSIGDRTHFLVQKNSSGDALFISRPVLGRVSNKRTVQFTRKLLAPDGTFAGVAVVSLDPYYLSRFYESISIGNGSILLSTTDGIVLARAPHGDALIGADLPADTAARVLRDPRADGYRAVSGIDHVDRIFNSRRLDHYPLIVSVGLAAEDVFAPYHRNRRLYFLAGALLSVAGAIIGWFMLRQRDSLFASRQALAATLENMSQGILMVDAQGGVPVLNRRAIELLGLPAGLLTRAPSFRQIVEWQLQQGEFGDDTTWDDALERILPARDNPHGDYTYERTRPNGTILKVRTQGLPDGAIVRTFTDITLRKQSEAALAAAQARAAHAERMQVLGQLAGGIAHDFNNILQAVQGSASLIARRAADAESVRRFARMIMDATQRGSSITRRLLAFARRGELRAEAIEPASLLAGLRDVLSHTLGSTIMVEAQVEPDLPHMLADKGQLETVLVNLATNARDAMSGGGTLTFIAAVEQVEGTCPGTGDLQPGRYIRLSITDTGTGMDAATLARALEPFFSTKPPGQGTGLGLSMAKGFVEQSGGTLAIDSVQGYGTAVHLWLPATATMEPPAPRPTHKPDVREDRGKRILLVDDEAMVRETLGASLQDLGYVVRLAADGAEALEILGSKISVDVLVTDLSMPGIDGLAVIRRARSLRPDLPAVLLTGYAGHGAQLAVGDSLEGGFVLVRKPATAAQLADRIEALLAISLAG